MKERPPCPSGGTDLGDERLEPIEGPRPDIEETRAARAAQKLAAGAGEHVAADRRDVDRELADGLGGVEKVEHVGGPCEAPHLRGRIHQTARSGHPRQADQLGPLVDQIGERGDVDLAGVVVRDDDDFRPVRCARCR